MSETCDKCKKNFLTEADDYLYSPVKMKFLCGVCVLSRHRNIEKQNKTLKENGVKSAFRSILLKIGLY